MSSCSHLALVIYCLKLFVLLCFGLEALNYSKSLCLSSWYQVVEVCVCMGGCLCGCLLSRKREREILQHCCYYKQVTDFYWQYFPGIELNWNHGRNWNRVCVWACSCVHKKFCCEGLHRALSKSVYEQESTVSQGWCHGTTNLWAEKRTIWAVAGYEGITLLGLLLITVS